MMMFKSADNKRESGNLNKKVKINDKTKQKQLTRAVQNFERRWRVEKLEALSSTNFETHGHGCLFAKTAAYVTVTRKITIYMSDVKRLTTFYHPSAGL